MIITTADGEVTIKEGERFLLAQSQGIAKGDDKKDKETGFSKGQKLSIIGGTAVVPPILSAILNDDNPSKKKPQN